MRRLLIAAIVWNGISSAARADEATDLLARAIKASAGSEESLAKRKYCLLKQTGVVFLPMTLRRRRAPGRSPFPIAANGSRR